MDFKDDVFEIKDSYKENYELYDLLKDVEDGLIECYEMINSEEGFMVMKKIDRGV